MDSMTVVIRLAESHGIYPVMTCEEEGGAGCLRGTSVPVKGIRWYPVI